MRLKIEANDTEVKGRRLIGCHYRYFLDDLNISNSLTDLKIRMSPRGANIAEIELMVDDVEVDGEFLAALEAHIKAQEDRE
jgi:hypothetical protein